MNNNNELRGLVERRERGREHRSNELPVAVVSMYRNYSEIFTLKLLFCYLSYVRDEIFVALTLSTGLHRS